MTSIPGALASLAMLAAVPAMAQATTDPQSASGRGTDAVERRSVQVQRHGSPPVARAPEAYFTGIVRVETPFRAGAPARVSGGTVIFEAGAYSAWHTHPLGQTLVVTEGVGRMQEWGGPVQEIRQGDVVSIPPGVKHWHGATPNSGMTHIAISEQLDGKSVDWMEKVSDEQYRK